MQKYLFRLLLYCTVLSTSGCSSLMYLWNSVVYPEQYRAVGIAQGNVRIEGLDIQHIHSIDIIHQVAFDFESLGGYGDGYIVNTDINNCKISGMGSIMSCTQNVSCISKLKVSDLYFESIIHCDTILL